MELCYGSAEALCEISAQINMQFVCVCVCMGWGRVFSVCMRASSSIWGNTLLRYEFINVIHRHIHTSARVSESHHRC